MKYIVNSKLKIKNAKVGLGWSVVRVLLLLLTAHCSLLTIHAQTTDFTYQGSLKDDVNVANGSYDFEFRLFDAVSGGAQIGSVAVRNGVTVANGVFAVTLDFGSGFPGADRFLEIRVRNAGGGGHTILDPRQKVNSAPYAVKSLNSENAVSAATAATANNALQLGGIAANQYVVTTDPRMTNARTPTAGSTNYIQNTTTLQSLSNFNITGNGTVGGNLTVNGTLAANLPPGDLSYVQNRLTPAQGGTNFNIAGSGTVGGNLTVNGTLAANLPAGDSSYVQNRSSVQPGTTNFNISGDGTLGGSLTVNNGKGVAYNANSGTNLRIYTFTTNTFEAILPGHGLSAETSIVFNGGFTGTPKVFVGDIDVTGGSVGQLFRVQLVLYFCSTTSGITTCRARLLNTSPNSVNYTITWNCMAIGL